MNDLRTGSEAYLERAPINASSLIVRAVESAIISASLDITAESSGGGSLGGNTSSAFNGNMATNNVSM